MMTCMFSCTLKYLCGRDGPKFNFAELRPNYSAELFGSIRLGNVVLSGRTSAELRYYSFFCHVRRLQRRTWQRTIIRI